MSFFLNVGHFTSKQQVQSSDGVLSLTLRLSAQGASRGQLSNIRGQVTERAHLDQHATIGESSEAESPHGDIRSAADGTPVLTSVYSSFRKQITSINEM